MVAVWKSLVLCLQYECKTSEIRDARGTLLNVTRLCAAIDVNCNAVPNCAFLENGDQECCTCMPQQELCLSPGESKISKIFSSRLCEV